MFLTFAAWVILSIVCAAIASGKGRSAVKVFLLSIVLSPLIGLLVVIALDKKERLTEDQKQCPFCAEFIKAEAIVCKHCGKDQPVTTPTPPAEVVKNTAYYNSFRPF